MKNKDRIEVLESQVRSLIERVEKLEAAQPKYPSPMPFGVISPNPVPMPWDAGQRPMYNIFSAQPGAIVK